MTFNIYDNGQFVNRIVGDEGFVSNYCEKHGYTYEAEPEQPEPDPEATDTEVLNALLGVTE